MDRIRQAVGDKELTYVGYSYGTYLGTLYARLFPRKVRALVLDGAIDPNLSAVEIGSEQAVGFERSLDAFLAPCSRNHRAHSTTAVTRPVHSTASRPRSTRSRLSPARSHAGPGEFYSGVCAGALRQAGYAQLEQALAAAQQGDGTSCSRLGRVHRSPRRRHVRLPHQAFWAIGVGTGQPGGGPNAYEVVGAQFRAAAPRLGVACSTPVSSAHTGRCRR